MEIVFYVRIKKMYGICLAFNKVDYTVMPERRILLWVTYAWGANRYAGWKTFFMWRNKCQ